MQVSCQCTRAAEPGAEMVQAQEPLDRCQALQVTGALQLLSQQGGGGGGGGGGSSSNR
jgi:hypothetical protein